ncbi:MAG: hypothetical protein WC205_04040 [Opitutaceae bacterium]|jgi:integrase
MPRLNNTEDKFLDFKRLPTILFRMKVEGPDGPVLIHRSIGRVDVPTARRVRDALVTTLEGAAICAKMGLALPHNELADQFGVQGMLKKLGLLSRKRSLASIGDLIAAFEADAPGRDLAKKTVGAASSSLRLILREVLRIEGPAVDMLPSSVLKWTVLQDFQALRVAAASPAGPAAVKTARITAASTISQARVIVGEPSMREANMRALLLPDLEEFRAWQPAASTRKVRVPVDDLTRARLRAACEDLWFAADGGDEVARAKWLATALAGNAGLRRGSAINARWDWVRMEHGEPKLYVVATDEAKPKGNETFIKLDASVWNDMQALKREGSVYIVPGATLKERDAVFKTTCEMLRGLGLNVDKPNHELRAVYAQEMRRQHGMEAAQDAMGHDKPRTTEGYTGKRGGDKSVRAL